MRGSGPGLDRPVEAKGDHYRTAKRTAASPSRAAGAQRAYFDAFRHLSAPNFGLRVLPVAAPECDRRIAYERFRAAMSEVGPGLIRVNLSTARVDSQTELVVAADMIVAAPVR
jgi:hypothetical protein